jgi:hypothetical protein
MTTNVVQLHSRQDDERSEHAEALVKARAAFLQHGNRERYIADVRAINARRSRERPIATRNGEPAHMNPEPRIKAPITMSEWRARHIMGAPDRLSRTEKWFLTAVGVSFIAVICTAIGV